MIVGDLKSDTLKISRGIIGIQTHLTSLDDLLTTTGLEDKLHTMSLKGLI